MDQEHIFFECNDNELAAIRTDNEGNEIARCKASIIDENTFDAAIAGLKSSIIDNRSTRFVVVSHLVDLNRGTFTANCKKHRQVNPFEERVWVDTAQLAWTLVFNGMIQSRDLKNVAAYYGVSYDGRSIMDKVSTLTEVYWRMMDRNTVALKVENGIRRSGVGLFSKVISSISR